MKVDKRANFCIFLVIAILALGLSNFAAAFTGDFVMGSFPGVNDTDKLIALDDDGFAPETLNAVYEPKPVVEEENETDNETDTNSTIDDDSDSDNDDNANSDSNSNSNDNGNSDSNNNNDDNNNDDSGGGNSDYGGKTPSDDSNNDE